MSKKKKLPESNCETCEFYDWDEDMQENVCIANLDEDEFYRIIATRQTRCPYYRQGDDYTLARRQ